MIPRQIRILTGVLTCLIVVGCGAGNMVLIPHIDTPEYHVRTGYRMLDMDKVDAANREFNRAIELNAKYAPAYVGISLVSGMRNEFEAGRSALHLADRYARGKSQEMAVQVGIMRFYLAVQDAYDENWWEQVDAAFHVAVVTDGSLPDPYYYMGQACMATRRFDLAARYFYRVTEIGEKYSTEAEKAYRLAEEKAALE